jgi:xanthine/uracil permease
MLVCTLGFKKTLGRYCVLIGIMLGYVLTLFLSHPKDSLKLSLLTDAPWFGIPQFAISGYPFQAELIIIVVAKHV